MSGYRPLGSDVALAPQPLLAPQPYAPPPTYPPPDGDNRIRHGQYDSVDEDRAKSLRTPEPTEEELKLLTIKGFTDWSEARNWRWWVRKEMIKNYIIFGILITISVLIIVFQKKIAKDLQPFGNKLKSLPAGFLVPVAILFILSFPPLFGAEIIELLCGLVWGPLVGTLIGLAGTFLGEIANFYVFKRFCMERGKKWEQGSIEYACFAHAVREGGWKMATAARWSFMPNHYVTAAFSTGGMTFLVFVISTVLSAPQVFFNVYPGYVLELEGEDKKTNLANIVLYVQLALQIIMTYIAARYMSTKMDQAKAPVIYARRKARQNKIYSA